MNQKEFLSILEPLEPKLFGFAYRMLRDEHKIKDAMQEMKLRLWNKRKELNKNSNISAYCFKIMHNICIDEFRYAELKMKLSSRTERSGVPGPDSVFPELTLERKEIIQRVRTIVDQLPDKQKAIIELHDFQELSHAEIADILEMEVNAVRVNLSRARAKIVAQFKKKEIYD